MSEKNQHLSDGKLAEEIARQYLEKQGLQLRQQNYRCRFGEIDLICDDKKIIVFVEVRYRKNQQFGGAKESISFHKQQKIMTTARHYLMQYPDSNCRFDVVLLTSLDVDNVEWIKNAFESSAIN